MTPPSKKPAPRKPAPRNPAAEDYARPKKPAARVARASHTTATVFTDRRIALLVAFLALVVGAMAAATVTGLAQSRSNYDLIEKQDEVLDIIKDSVEPDGRRFQEGQARTASAVSTINEISVLAAHCAHKHADLVAIQVCVEVEYRRLHPTPTTTP